MLISTYCIKILSTLTDAHEQTMKSCSFIN